MKAEIKGKELIITIPIKEKISKSGKNLLIATTGGNAVTTAEYKNKKVTVGMNAWIDND